MILWISIVALLVVMLVYAIYKYTKRCKRCEGLGKIIGYPFVGGEPPICPDCMGTGMSPKVVGYTGRDKRAGKDKRDGIL